jgi:cyclopropane fatty-acyl-phospholipid synthase-like methyltransferase
MHSYAHFAKFYDATMGDRAGSAQFVHTLIQKHAPEARSLLELACGTGALLEHLAAHYDVTGLDLSPQMLRIARAKLPKVELHRADMTAFDLGRTFDAIICMYDSINHLLTFRSWKEVFRCSAKHLAKRGLFIFDINTEAQLQRHAREPAWVKALDNGTVIIKASDAGKGVSNWNIKVFEHQRGRRYRLHEENIHEISFPVDRVVKALRQHFSRVRVLDPARVRPSRKSDRLYFVCSRE